MPLVIALKITLLERRINMKKQIIILLSILVGLLIACDDNVEINYVAPVIPQANFQVDFDGETWVADTVTATIIDGEIHMIATQNATDEVVEIKLLADQEGSYNFTPTTNYGYMNYTPNVTETAFANTSGELAGRINMDTIDVNEQLLTGTFFFVGKRSVQQFNPDGSPMIDSVTGENVYVQETKDFTNGIFENIVYSTVVDSDPTDPNTDTFFVKMDGVEFIESTLTAEKITIAGVDVINIRATRDGSNEVIEFRIPINITAGNKIIYDYTADPLTDCMGKYQKLSSSETYYSAGMGTGANPDILAITSHDPVTNKIVSNNFQFTAVEESSGATIEFTEGEFSLTYTE